MLVYKLKLVGDSMVYWLTKENATPIINRWERQERGVVIIPKYGIGISLNRISEIRKVEESEPYPTEFKEQLVSRNGGSLPQLPSEIESIKGLPTNLVLLDENLKLIRHRTDQELSGTEVSLKKKWLNNPKSVPYFYYATAHFREGENGNEYLLGKGQIKKLVKVKFDPEYPSLFPSATLVLGEWKYGVPNNALNERTGAEQVCYN